MRILIHVEGQTEESFVNEVLRSELLSYGYTNIGARLMGNARLRINRGGVRSWDSVKGDVVRHLKEDVHAVSTIMVDYYAMPSTGSRAWPGRDQFQGNGSTKAEAVESAIKVDIASEFNGQPQHRFIPFVLMYEFEALLFSETALFANGIGQPKIASTLASIREQFDTPEDINDSPETAPSKRILELIPGYEKPFHGTLGALEIGLEKIKEECPRFKAWLGKLKVLAS